MLCNDHQDTIKPKLIDVLQQIEISSLLKADLNLLKEELLHITTGVYNRNQAEAKV